METKQCSRCKKDKVLTEYEDNRRQCNKCIEWRHAYYNNNKDKHKEWDRRHYETHQEQEKAYRAVKIECPVCKVMILKYNRSDHEKTKRHNPKQTKKQVKQQQDKQKEEEEHDHRIKHQQTLEYINDTFPSFQILGE